MRLPATLSRRALGGLLAAAAAGGLRPRSATASGVGATGVGPDGLFANCPASDTCVSSQDDRPMCWDNPWVAEGSLEDSRTALSRVVTRLGGQIAETDGERYLRAEFRSSNLLGQPTVDDAEFYFTPNDTLVQFRASRRGETPSDLGANRRRLEKIRIALGWEKVPVLRNRRQVSFPPIFHPIYRAPHCCYT